MKREEYLDRLLERQDYRGNRRSASNDEITASMTAAERLTRLQEIDVPADFARRLELSLRAHCRIQQNSKVASNRRDLCWREE